MPGYCTILNAIQGSLLMVVLALNWFYVEHFEYNGILQTLSFNLLFYFEIIAVFGTKNVCS